MNIERLKDKLLERGFSLDYLLNNRGLIGAIFEEINITRLEHQLFIGKVSDEIGFDRTVELLKECKEAFK
jgi:hypothetical protein